MSDIFLLKYLQKTVGGANAAEDWAAFKRKQDEGIDLSQADLENHDLRGYDFANVNLSAARFYNTNLSGADLSGATLAYADMRRVDLSGAVLAGANLSGATLESINAVGTRFENARLCGCKLRGSHLAGAIFVGADLENADFGRANLKFADLTGANLKSANVDEAILIGCKIDEEAKPQLRGLEHAILEENQPVQPRRQSALAQSANNGGPKTLEEARKILQIDGSAQRRDIVKAYRKLVMEYHPDRVQHLGEKLQKVAEEEFQRVQQAYEMLTDPAVAEQAQAKAQQVAPREYSLHELLQLAKENPNNDRVFYNLGRKFYEAGMLERAIDAYEKALKLNSGNVYAAHNLKIAKLTQALGKK